MTWPRWWSVDWRKHWSRIVVSESVDDSVGEILEEISQRDNLTVPALVTRLYYESIDAGHDMGNFTSFLRVCCARYFNLQLSGHITQDKNVSILSLDADKILHEEKNSRFKKSKS